MKKIEMSFICKELQLEETTLWNWINCRLVQPIDVEGPYFDEEDFSRIQFLADIQRVYDTNDESLEVILHLVDQIHLLQSEIKKIKIKSEA